VTGRSRHGIGDELHGLSGRVLYGHGENYAPPLDAQRDIHGMPGARDDASAAGVPECLRAGNAAGSRVNPTGRILARGKSPTCQSSEVLVRRGLRYRDQQEENLTGLSAFGSTLSSSRDGRMEIPEESQVHTNVVRFPKEVTS
jgi:hypothetical protein